MIETILAIGNMLYTGLDLYGNWKTAQTFVVGDAMQQRLEQILAAQRALEGKVAAQFQRIDDRLVYAANQEALHWRAPPKDLPRDLEPSQETLREIARPVHEALTKLNNGAPQPMLGSALIALPPGFVGRVRRPCALEYFIEDPIPCPATDDCIGVFFKNPQGADCIGYLDRAALAAAGLELHTDWRPNGRVLPPALRRQEDEVRRILGLQPVSPPSPSPKAKPTPVQGQRVPLRAEPTALSEAQAKAMFKKRGFFATDWNQSGRFDNDLVDNGNGTITDRATGLLWQKGGSEKNMVFKQTKAYIADLNKRRFAGRTDWRLPTLEEAASLLEPEQRNGDLYIDPLFDKTQRWIWTSDETEQGSAAPWHVFFHDGFVHWSDTAHGFRVRGCCAAGQ